MHADEMSELLTLFSDSGRWCRNAEAKNARGMPVRYNDPDAIAWDLTGALCLLFGWQRACALFRQIDKHLLRDRSLRWRVQDPCIESMLALQDCNDRASTTFEWLINRLRHMHVLEREDDTAPSDPSELSPSLEPDSAISKSPQPLGR